MKKINAETAKEIGKNWWESIGISAQRFMDDRILTMSVPALTFSSLMASVPLVAMLFALSRGFGDSGMVENWVREAFQSQPNVADAILQFANNYLQHTKNTYIIGVGVVVILWSLFFLMRNIEDTFNHIWHAERRGWLSMITNYIAIFIFFVVLISLSFLINLGAYTIGDTMDKMLGLGWLANGGSRMASIASLSLFFFFIYNYIPNTHVKWKYTLAPSLLAGIAMSFLQYGYVYIQLWLASYNIIYGSFAALPLFLIWLECSWYICLGCAVLANSRQNLQYYNANNKYFEMSDDTQMKLCGDILTEVERSFDTCKSETLTQLEERLKTLQRSMKEELKHASQTTKKQKVH